MKTPVSKGKGSKPAVRRKPRWAVESAEPVDVTRYTSKTLERAFDALEAFTPGRTTLSLKELSSLTKQPESSLFRTLLTLQKRGYLQQQTDGAYFLSPKLMYARRLDASDSLRLYARPFLEELVAKFDESASLSYVFDNYVRVLDTAESAQEIRMGNRIGRIIPPHCSAMGKAVLAFGNQDSINEFLETYGLTRRTPNTIVDRRMLLQELDKIRAQGFAVDREESALHGICYAAPIFLDDGSVVGALSVSTPTLRISPQLEKKIARGVVEAATKISRGMPRS